MTDSPPDDEPCQQCGLCCRIFGPGITPTTQNLYIWMEQGRKDILQWFIAVTEDSRQVRGTDLLPEDLSAVSYVEMRNPQTGELVPVCPFLRRVGRTRYLCGIHTVKPEMCCTYQPWVWGETYFNRCPALKKVEGKSRWPF